MHRNSAPGSDRYIPAHVSRHGVRYEREAVFAEQCSKDDPHFVCRKRRAQTSAMTTSERQKLEWGEFTLEKSLGAEDFRFRVNGGIEVDRGNRCANVCTYGEVPIAQSKWLCDTPGNNGQYGASAQGFIAYGSEIRQLGQ